MTPDRAVDFIERINEKFRPTWAARSRDEQVALASYFLPHSSSKPILEPTRPRVIKWYCPFAAQSEFPSGHRYCINVYTGCSHRCEYCYAAAYEPDKASCKKDFQRVVDRDMEELERFDVPPAPVHLSNSTDPFQPLEARFGHAKYALEQILAHRHRFTSVVILTKNPLLSVQRGYIDLFQKLARLPTDHRKHEEFTRRGIPGFLIEVSLAFWQEEARITYDPGAPTIAERIEGIRALREAGIPLVLRIDPLFPRSPITEHPRKTLTDFGLPEAQTIDDLENLVKLAKEMGVRHVVYSPVKITQPRRRKLSDTMRAMREAYRGIAAPAKLVFRGGSWRLPPEIAEARVVRPFLEICDRVGVPAKHCMRNLVETP